jgi:hypothetical protein
MDRYFVFIAEGAHTRLCPRIVLTCAFARSVEKGRDAHIRHQSREFSDDVRSRRIQSPAMLTVPRFTNLELGVVAALTMQHQMHFLTFETSDDLSKDGTQDALACFCCCGWMVPRALEVRAKREQLRAFLLT